MQVILVHHADAVGPEVDPQRPLSTHGRAQADRLADRVGAAALAPAAIWHSGKLRARQTAEPFLRLNPFAEFKMVRGLGPDDPPAIMRDAILRESRDVLLVGHMPNLDALLRLLLGVGAALPPHGCVVLESGDAGLTWTEVRRFESA